MSSFVDSLLRKAQGKSVDRAPEFDCLVLEQPPQEWALIRQCICEGTLQSSFDKGDLALIAENAILWYDRLRRNARNELCLSSTPHASPEMPSVDTTLPVSPPLLPAAAEVENSSALWSPDSQQQEPVSPVAAIAKKRAQEEAWLDREAYVETLHEVLSERTKKVIKTEQLLRQRNRHILDLQRQLEEQVAGSDSVLTAARMSLEKASSQNALLRSNLEELQLEVSAELRELGGLADKHMRLWSRVTDGDGCVILGTPRSRQRGSVDPSPRGVRNVTAGERALDTASTEISLL
eukprot:TRINITY_DN37512_c0_g1_i1.p1 TRINITY_DN37512_c0_g1~~TRINITY_DN37512_c0_g1_i1.p1  ORF type:complete len:293 (-),score=56.72 TRINITY_DN37512_c0_g1_i1:153-1031(-)